MIWQVQLKAVAILFMIYGDHMNILYIIKVKLSFLWEWQYMSWLHPIMLITEPEIVNNVWSM